MSDYLRSETLLDEHLIAGRVCMSKFDHAHRVKDIISDFGGRDRDKAASLLHEVLEGLEDKGFSEVFLEYLSVVQSCMADFLQDSDSVISLKLANLSEAHLGVKIIWLCDVIDSFEHPIISLGLPSDRMKDVLEERCYQAREALHVVSPARTSYLLARARRSIMEFGMRNGAGLL